MYSPCIIKSFKHNGHIHRTWLENWLVPSDLRHPDHAAEAMHVLINHHTRIIESDGKEWVSRIPAVSFFIPNQWYNIVALIEETGVRYYCNIASPSYHHGQTITYIDYDLDVIVMPSREFNIVDMDEYEEHKVRYYYSDMVDDKVKEGLSALLQRIRNHEPPFQDDIVRKYYDVWKNTHNK